MKASYSNCEICDKVYCDSWRGGCCEGCNRHLCGECFNEMSNKYGLVGSAGLLEKCDVCVEENVDYEALSHYLMTYVNETIDASLDEMWLAYLEDRKQNKVEDIDND